MRKTINKLGKDDFVHDFMLCYKSPGYNVPMIRMAYGRPFEVIELHNSYKVIIRGNVRRYNNLYQVGEFIYESNFDLREVYRPALSARQLKRIIKERKASSKEPKYYPWIDKLVTSIKRPFYYHVVA